MNYNVLILIVLVIFAISPFVLIPAEYQEQIPWFNKLHIGIVLAVSGIIGGHMIIKWLQKTS